VTAAATVPETAAETDVGGLMAETRFEGSSPVARYWLSKCEGFAVTGGERGVVEELIRDADPFVTTRLVVRTGRRRRAVVPAEAVAAVDPAERVVFIARRRRKHVTRTAMTRAAAGARRSGARAAPAFESAGRTTRRVAAVTALSTRQHAPKIAKSARRTTALVATTAAASTRHAPRLGHYVRRRIEPAAAIVARSFSLLLAELAATARMTTTTCAIAGNRVRRQLTDGSSGIRDTSS
jgi:hypothetical protein